MRLLIRWLLGAVAIWFTSVILTGISFTGVGSVLVAALLLGIVNALMRPILVILTLPVTILSLGLFLLVINAFLLWLVSALVPGFVVSGFWWALLGSIVISIFNMILNMFVH